MVLYSMGSDLLRGIGEQELMMERGAIVLMYSFGMIVW